MKYKFFVYSPDKIDIINRIIESASKFGAGIYGNYSQVAFITRGEGNWKSEKGAKPFQGTVGKVTRTPVARIEMTCLSKNAKQIENAIKQIHPWEQVDIEFFRVEEI